jgi:septum formation protein
LASTSVYRRQLLARLQIRFEVESPGVDETPEEGETAAALTGRLARQKARAVAARHPDAWVIGSDQVAVLTEGAGAPAVLGKPGTVANAVSQLERCSGRTLEYLTAVALVRHADASLIEFTDHTRVVFRSLDRAAIERYVVADAPLDCAGSFKSEGLGISLCESIDSLDPTGIIGLPLLRLCGALRGAGFEIP